MKKLIMFVSNAMFLIGTIFMAAALLETFRRVYEIYLVHPEKRADCLFATALVFGIVGIGIRTVFDYLKISNK